MTDRHSVGGYGYGYGYGPSVNLAQLRPDQAKLGCNAAEWGETIVCSQSAVYACGSRELEYLTISLCDARVLEKPERNQSNWSFILVKWSGECLTQIGIFRHSLNTIYILAGY